MPRGGARPGAGRKKKAVVAAEYLNAVVAQSEPNRGHAGKGRAPGVPNRATRTLKAYAQEYTAEAVLGLVTLARHHKTPAAAKVTAWREVLDRGHGKPKEFHDVTHTMKPDLSKLSSDELATIEGLLAKAAAGESDAVVH